MIVQQVLKYIDSKLESKSGTKVQILTKDKSEVVKIFISNKETKSYDYIINFIKEIDTEDKKVFKSSITSGYSGLEYKLEFEFGDEIYESVKRAVLIADSKHMNSLEFEIDAIKIEEIKIDEEQSPISS